MSSFWGAVPVKVTLPVIVAPPAAGAAAALAGAGALAGAAAADFAGGASSSSSSFLPPQAVTASARTAITRAANRCLNIKSPFNEFFRKIIGAARSWSRFAPGAEHDWNIERHASYRVGGREGRR